MLSFINIRGPYSCEIKNRYLCGFSQACSLRSSVAGAREVELKKPRKIAAATSQL